jgi:hypothetical protein
MKKKELEKANGGLIGWPGGLTGAIAPMPDILKPYPGPGEPFDFIFL